MKCLILSGNPEPSGFDAYLDGFARGLNEKGHEVKRIDLRELKLAFCTGCWSCWWASPGLCAIKDDMVTVYPQMVEADLVVWASPLVMGTMSSLKKKVQDRFIPLAHPYIELYKGECHHRHRYARNADIGLIVEATPQDGPEDIALAKRFFERFSRNTRSKFRLFASTERSIEEAVDEAITA